MSDDINIFFIIFSSITIGILLAFTFTVLIELILVIIFTLLVEIILRVKTLNKTQNTIIPINNK